MRLRFNRSFVRAVAIPALVSIAAALLATGPAYGQSGYFGRNKVQYERFDYQILKTDHFDVYFYPEEKAAVRVAAQMAERWYKRYSRLLNHELRGRQALIIYASHPQFEQTTVLPELISEGMGGVTESYKRRIVVPFGGSLEETDHVIGHELVHAFQYDISAGATPIYAQQQGGGIEKAPLWFVEGLAEYLSIGPVDAHTAMWMRDMITKKKLPTIKDLNNPNKYFPYRYGQSVWAYIGGRWGDLVVTKLMKDVIRGLDYEKAIERTLGLKLDALSKAWQESIKNDYASLSTSTQLPNSTGRLLVKGTEMEGLNVAPALSPDGKKFLFLSSRDLFSIELYMSDTATGKVTRKITKTAVDTKFQSIQFIYSAGSWDLAGDRFVFGAVMAGKPVLAFLDGEGRKLDQDIRFDNLGEILNPTWSPDGKRIAFSALGGGFSDIYIYNLETKELKNMTSDPYGDLQPVWSPDGRMIAFVTERFTAQVTDRLLSTGGYRLAALDPETGEVKIIPTFKEGKSINPQWSADSQSLFFVADQNGISNIYRLDLGSKDIRQITNLYTGVSGITDVSPTLSIAAKSNDLLYSVYNDGNYSIYSVEPKELLAGHPVQEATLNTTPAVLSPRERQGSEILGLLKNSTYGLPDASKFTETPYKAKLSLDYVSTPTIGVGYDRYYGAYGGGGIALTWSDMLGHHNLMTAAQVNNRLMDSAAMVAYMNSKNRLNWGAVLQRIPVVYGNYYYGYDVVDGQMAEVDQEVLYRQIYYEAGAFATYPFSPAQRFDLSVAYNYIQFDNVIYESAYTYDGWPIYVNQKTQLPSPAGLHLAYASAALVYDTANYGATAPILGMSYRLEVSPTVGSLNYYTLLADFRKYIMPVKPFTLAFRVMHYGRYGKGADDERLWPMFLGYDWYIRGYNYNSFSDDPSNFDLNQLFGSKMIVANFELRFPLFGALGIGKGFYGIFPVDFIAFYDAGVAWGQSYYADANGSATSTKPWFVSGGTQKALTSAGIGIRVNVFGYAVLGLNYVHPFQREGKGSYFQVTFYPGF
jgi:Tol biopolymer transport system component